MGECNGELGDFVKTTPIKSYFGKLKLIKAPTMLNIDRSSPSNWMILIHVFVAVCVLLS